MYNHFSPFKDQNRKNDGPRTPTKKGGNCVETAGTRTVGRPRSDRIRTRDQNTDPKQEVIMDIQYIDLLTGENLSSNFHKSY